MTQDSPPREHGLSESSKRIKTRGRDRRGRGSLRGAFCLEGNDPLASAVLRPKPKAWGEFAHFILMLLGGVGAAVVPVLQMQEMGAQGGEATCPGPHSMTVADLGSRGGQAGIYRWRTLPAHSPPGHPPAPGATGKVEALNAEAP